MKCFIGTFRDWRKMEGIVADDGGHDDLLAAIRKLNETLGEDVLGQLVIIDTPGDIWAESEAQDILLDFPEVCPGLGLMDGRAIIDEERLRQIHVEGYTARHDDTRNSRLQLAQAAHAYVRASQMLQRGWTPEEIKGVIPWVVGWSIECFKIGYDPAKCLAKAGAPELAEKERITRAGYGAEVIETVQQRVDRCAFEINRLGHEWATIRDTLPTWNKHVKARLQEGEGAKRNAN